MTQYKADAPPALHRRATSTAFAAALALALGLAVAQPVAAQAPEATPYSSLADAQIAAEEATLLDTAPLRYVVQKGDTLWGIANRYLADPWQWPELWYVNGQLKNPHQIYPGDVLELYNVKGRTRLVRSGDLERLVPQVRESELGDGLPAIPIDAIRNFLNGPRAVDLDTLNAAPYLLAFADDRLMGAAQMSVYIKQLSPRQGAVFSTVRKGVAYKDPDTGELLGYEAIPSGEVEIKNYDTPSLGVMTKSTREVLAGDRMLPLEANNFLANFYPHAPQGAVNGRIISVYDGVSQIGQYHIVAMNRGSKHGLETGHVLSIQQASRKVKDPVTGKPDYLPKQEAGLLMVFKVMPRISYGLVMKATSEIHVMDHVEKPNAIR